MRTPSYAGCACLLVGLALFSATGCGESSRGNGANIAETSRTTSVIPPAAQARRSFPRGVVAYVDGAPIRQSAVEHWAAVQAKLEYGSRGVRRVPRGVLPTPPGYRDCIVFLRSTRKRRPATTGELRASCVRRLHELQRQALETLIERSWIEHEAASAHVAVSRNTVEALEKRQYGSQARLSRFLVATGLHVADLRAIGRTELLRETWQRRTLPVYERLRHSKPPETAQMAGEVDVELQRSNERTARKWTPLTDCASGHVVAMCRSYALSHR